MIGLVGALTPQEQYGGLLEPAKRPMRGKEAIGLARGLLSEEPGYTYGQMLPMRQEQTTGAYSPAMPGFAREFGVGLLDLLEGPRTGQMTPEATMALLDIPMAGTLGMGATGARPPEGLLAALRAYHGSPHRFDRFDMSKIGTGEGAQAYGHGLYFAESPGVARSYQKMLEGTVDPAFFDKMSFADESSVKHIFDVAEEGMTNQQIIGRIQRNLMDDYAARIKLEGSDPNTFRGQLAKEVEQRIAEKEHAMEVVAARGHLLKKRGEGALYTTKLNVEPEDLLDWDLPLSQQSEKVRAALENSEGGQLAISTAKKMGFGSGDPTGQQIYEALQAYGEKAKSTERLREAGIPGIRYLDQGSRATGEGTRNFVIFDDSLIDIEGVE